MAIEKKINSQEDNHSLKLSSVDKFSVGNSYEYDEKVWKVVKAYVEDNVEMREMINNYGEHEVLMLSTLMKDKDNYNRVVE